MRLIRALALSASMALAAPALAQAPEAAIATLFQEIAADRGLVRAEAKHWFGDLGPHYETLAGFISAVFAEPGFAAYVLEQEGPPEGDIAAWLADTVAVVGTRALEPAWSIDRLGLEAQLAYLDYMIGFSDWVGTERTSDCPVLATGDPRDPEFAALLAAYRSTLPEERVAAHYAMLLDALRALVNDTPPVNDFPRGQLDAAQATYQAALRASPEGVILLELVAGNAAAAAPVEICRVLSAAYRILRDLPEPGRTPAVQLMMEGRMRLD